MGLERYVVDAVLTPAGPDRSRAPDQTRPPPRGWRSGPNRDRVGGLLRALTIDPTRDYQPLNGRWPVHNVLRQASAMS